MSTSIRAPRAIACLTLALGLVGLSSACADPCVDDGLKQEFCPGAADNDADSVGGTAEGTADEAGTADGTADGSESGTAEGSTTNGDMDGTADATADTTTDATADTTADTGDGTTGIDPNCSNGVLDEGETDIDCGGVCGMTCFDGDDCIDDGDCKDSPCNMGVCNDPVCNPEQNNGCQGCLQQQCCDQMIACFDDPGCTCWFECISHNNDFAPCQDACNVGNIGTITSCANSKCNTEDACAVP